VGASPRRGGGATGFGLEAGSIGAVSGLTGAGKHRQSACTGYRLIQINAGVSVGRHHVNISEKGNDMAVQKSGARKLVTRMLATGVLLSLYAFGVVASTGAMGVSSAYAQRGRGRGRGRGGGNVGLGIGLGIGAAVIGGAIAASAAEQQRRDAIGYCMQRFRSYDPQSMTYLGNDGYRHPCP